MDPIIGGALISGGIQLGGSVLQNLFNWRQNEKANSINETLMRESWTRDDSAVQRRVADLKAAGLSPTLAAGSAAAPSDPIQVSKFQAAQGGVLQSALLGAELNMMRKQNQKLDAEIANLRADAGHTEALTGEIGKESGRKDAYLTVAQSQAEASNALHRADEALRKEQTSWLGMEKSRSVIGLELENDLKYIQAQLAKETFDISVDEARARGFKSYTDYQSAVVDFQKKTIEFERMAKDPMSDGKGLAALGSSIIRAFNYLFGVTR